MTNRAYRAYRAYCAHRAYHARQSAWPLWLKWSLLLAAGLCVLGCDATLPGGSYPTDTDAPLRLHLDQNADYAGADWCLPGRSILVEFSHPMQTASVRQALSLTPTIEWQLRWNDSATRLTIAPMQMWRSLTTYRLRIDSSAHSMAGQSLPRGFATVCRNEDDGAAPAVVAIDSVRGGLSPSEQATAVGVSLLANGGRNSAGEPIDGRSDTHIGELGRVGDALRITFSEAMEQADVERALTITPTLAATLVWPTDRIVLFRPSAEFAIGRSYYLTISDEARDRRAKPLARSLLVRFRFSGDYLRLLYINLQEGGRVEQFATTTPLEIEPRSPLVNDYTFLFTFNRPFVMDNEKSAALRHITVRNLTRTGLPAVSRRSFNWIGDSSLSITYYGVVPSGGDLRNYLLLSLRGGPSGLRDSAGGYLERDIEQLFVVRERTP